MHTNLNMSKPPIKKKSKKILEMPGDSETHIFEHTGVL